MKGKEREQEGKEEGRQTRDGREGTNHAQRLGHSRGQVRMMRMN